MNVQDWIEKNTILMVTHGSHAYGTNIETSDVDTRGVCVPPAPYHHGYLLHFDQLVRNDPDVTIFGIKKFCALAADGNPNVLELLFVQPNCVLKTTEAGLLLMANRHLFISRKLKHTLSGYAYSQLKRIKTHRHWLLDPPKAQPTREEFGLPERTVLPKDQLATATSLVSKQVELWGEAFAPNGLDDAGRIAISTALAEMRLASDAEFRAAGRVIGLSENFLEILARERAYSSAKDNWTQFKNWEEKRNPARHALEAVHGYDTKHGMHLVRLMRMCCEVLEHGELVVHRPDAKELLEIRNGAWSFDKLVAYAQDMRDRADELDKTTKLPRDPKRLEIDALCQRLVAMYL